MRPPARNPLAALPAAVLLAALAAGCGGPPPPPAPAEAPPGYIQLRETFGPRDFGPLAGRRIVLDPGHGGRFRGALGPAGLAEADVNLGVALHLRGLLEWAGATVAMTRTADYDFLSPADSSLVADLAFRVSFTDSAQPDVFISIHHNSTASADPTINETQTYYPLGDDGASVDLAQAIHRHLVLNLEISPARILPGNFHVLRDATVPAVLGEPAMISHPVMEGRLSQAAAQRLEAEAYFLGLLDYFAGGNPRWRAAQPDTVVSGDTDTLLAWTFGDDRPGAPGPDPATFVLQVDGRTVDHALSPDGATVLWSCAPLPGSGPRRVTLHGRNLAGRRTPPVGVVVQSAHAAVLEVALLNEAARPGPRRAHLTCTAPDRGPVPQGRLGWPERGAQGQLELGGTGAAGVVERGAGPPVFVPADAGAPPVRLELRERTLAPDRRLIPILGAGRQPWMARQGAADAAAPPLVGGAVVQSDQPVWFESPGRLPLVAGPEPLEVLTSTPLVSALDGITIVIDPAGGGTASDGQGPLGLRGADINLAVARHLARLLERCGARVLLTRAEGEVPTATAKVSLADTVGAALFLSVGRAGAADQVVVRHHPRSSAGLAWAGHAAGALGRLLPGATPRVEPSWSYLLRHTACPALEILLPGPLTTADELRLGLPAWQAAEARALLLGIAGAADGQAQPTADPARILPQLDGAPTPAHVSWARWDGNLPWYPLPDPAVAARPLGAAASDSVSSWGEPGLPAPGTVHYLEIHTPDAWQLWRLERIDQQQWRGHLARRGMTDSSGDD